MSLLVIIAFVSVTDWKTASDKDGIVVMQRAASGSDFDEFRLTTLTDVSPQQITAVIWDHANYASNVPFVRSIKLLSQDEDEHYAYLEIAMPVLTDRDYCMRYFRHVDEHGVVTMTGSIDNTGCPAERSSYVRIKRQNASWTLTPTTTGGCQVVYQVHTDLDGSVPPALVNMSTGKEHAKFLRAMIQHAAKRQR